MNLELLDILIQALVSNTNKIYYIWNIDECLDQYRMLKLIPGTYIIRNLFTNEAYVGSAVDLHDRLREHLVYRCNSNIRSML